MEQVQREEFTQAVYAIVRLIPAGRATSYGALARAAGYPGYARMAGRVMGLCDSAATGIPAHRVVNSAGELSGRFAFETPEQMQELLEAEGVAVRNHRIVGWKKVFWNPLEEL